MVVADRFQELAQVAVEFWTNANKRRLEQLADEWEPWIRALLTEPLPADWQAEVDRFVENVRRSIGLVILPDSVRQIEDLVRSRADGTGVFAVIGPAPVQGESSGPAADAPARSLDLVGDEEEAEEDVALEDEIDERRAALQSLIAAAPPIESALADLHFPAGSGIDPGDYTPASQKIIRMLGPDWTHVSTAAMNRVRALGQLVDQNTGAVLGHGANSLGFETFVRLERKTGAIDTAHFKLVLPLFTSPHWALLKIQRGVAPERAAAALAAQQKIRHDDAMRVRGAINRAQGGMFAVIYGIGGIAEGAPLLGTIEAAGGVEQVTLSGVDLATGEEHRAWSARGVQAALEAAGVDPKTARFLADNGGLLIALGRASVDAAGTASAVIKTSTGYRIRITFDPATLSANGLGGAKIKATRTGPGGKAKQPAPASTLRRAKPPLPPPQSRKRFSWQGHKTAAKAEEQLARTIHALPDQVVVRWGDPIGTHGSDVISVNIKTGEVTLWDVKFRGSSVRVRPSKTFSKLTGKRLANAIATAKQTVAANTTLPKKVRTTALNNLDQKQVITRTVGAGNAKNSTLK